MQEQSVPGDDGFLDYLQHDVESPPLVTCLEEIAEHWRTSAEEKEIVGKDPNPASLTAPILKYRGQWVQGTPCLSTMDILRAAMKKHVEAPPTNAIEDGSLQQVELLIAAAKKIGCRRFDEALMLLDSCDQCSSDSGNPVERLAFQFSNALTREDSSGCHSLLLEVPS
ncbi:hypothetical protein MLD38_016377 [Melastoma candidum]|uniref:Uncharacterized protein n=1 Tax=Melastoma candidum TaxID=119954 RepID=A0ACB9RNG1_9MYRT|nr:hypothetical protein MLD38_016377 [Melastoma candidum]